MNKIGESVVYEKSKSGDNIRRRRYSMRYEREKMSVCYMKI